VREIRLFDVFILPNSGSERRYWNTKRAQKHAQQRQGYVPTLVCSQAPRRCADNVRQCTGETGSQPAPDSAPIREPRPSRCPRHHESQRLQHLAYRAHLAAFTFPLAPSSPLGGEEEGT